MWLEELFGLHVPSPVVGSCEGKHAATVVRPLIRRICCGLPTRPNVLSVGCFQLPFVGLVDFSPMSIPRILVLEGFVAGDTILLSILLLSFDTILLWQEAWELAGHGDVFSSFWAEWGLGRERL